MVRSVIASTLSAMFVGALVFSTAAPVAAQSQTANRSTTATGGTKSVPASSTSNLTDAQLGDLVGRIALYPDDLLALVLPASTVPLEVVQAQRFLKEAKGKKDAKPPASLSEPVRNLLNYPDIIDQMNNDLTWTQKLGEAVYEDQQGVMDAVQRFRMMAYAAGNLKSDDKQKVEVKDQIVTIEPAKPDVIYVPRYEPTTVVYASSVPVYGYYPNPYPVYYYPYAPGAAFASGLFWGATAAWAFGWASGSIGWGHSDVDIDINSNRNVNRNTDRNTDRSGDRGGDRGGNRGNGSNRAGSGSGTWSPKGGSGGGNRAATRPGDAGFRPSTGGNRPTAGTGNRTGAGGAGAGNRPGAGGGGNFSQSTRPATRPSNGASSRPSTSNTSRAGSGSARSSSYSSPRTSSYGGMSGQQSRAASQRGSSSRSSGASRGGGGRRGGGGGRRH